MEYFSRMLGMASQQHAFHFHPKCAPHHICHLAFADDVLLLCRGDCSSIQILVEQLHAFSRASRLHINATKSFIYFGGIGDSLKHNILQDSGFSEGSFPFKYLGSSSAHTGFWLASSILSCINLKMLFKAGWANTYPMLGGWN
jgi:hypothetical protein